tara:strand:+ start:619 stop:2043 length:1425 start_codon:yes stop_codon:yes gene_type:complete
MSFLIYDIIFLVLFATFLFVFLHSGKKNLKREGLLILYKASWGIKLINYVGKKSPRTFKVLSYISIVMGYILMVTMFYLLGKIVYLYVTLPSLVQAIKVPPIMPLVPYLPQIFKLDFLPPFYFTYWIVIIAIIAISHEFAHGIFAAYNKIKIKTTGFGFFPFFLPIFLAAFVELDEKKMAKKNKFPQLAILSAGTFANVLTAILFFGILWVFFFFTFTPSGIIFDSYPYSFVEVSGISMINGISLENPTYEKILNLSNKEGFNKIKINDQDYITTKDFLEQQKNNDENVILYYDGPAINIELESVISKINGKEIKNIDNLREEMLKYSPGEKVTLNVLGEDGNDYDKDIILGENPEDKSKAWLGIGFSEQERRGVMGKIFSILSFKDPHVYYKSNFGASLFIYNLLWWTILISLSVALINMLPVGMFDGGRFFYLTVLGITKSEKTAKNLFAFSTYFILFLLLLLMFFYLLYII